MVRTIEAGSVAIFAMLPTKAGSIRIPEFLGRGPNGGGGLGRGRRTGEFSQLGFLGGDSGFGAFKENVHDGLCILRDSRLQSGVSQF